jgi:hypothetical protein
MYGFSGYGTNAYGSERQASLAAKVVKFGARIMKSLYGIAVSFLRVQPSMKLQSLYGVPLKVSRFNSSRTFNDPETQSLTMKLPA